MKTVLNPKQAVVSIILLLLSVFVLFSLFKERCGVVENYRDLPKYGSALPDVGTGAIHYCYNPLTGKLLTKTYGSMNLFNSICDKFDLQQGVYDGNVSKSDFISEDVPIDFIPKGSSILYKYGRLYNQGRPLLHVYIEEGNQDEDSNSAIYVHVN